MWYMHGVSGWGMFFGGLGMAILWGGIIGLIIWGINRLAVRSSYTIIAVPLDIARENYASGRITRAEYEQIIKTLS